MSINDDLTESDEPVVPDEDLSLEDIEAAYLRALETAEVADAIYSEVAEEDESEPDSEQEDRHDQDSISTEESNGLSLHSPDSDNDSELDTAAEERLTPVQVIEGMLFVGGKPLPAKKMSDVLGGTLSHEQVDEYVEQLNDRYRLQNRPYEIRLVEGGYQMCLLYAYEPVRSRVYGQGPKEVKLSQEVLEILAFVAYQQPVTKADVEETDKKNVKSILRQLLRRQLIHLERGDEDTYHTTPRFLQVFGLTDIADLPQSIDFSFK